MSQSANSSTSTQTRCGSPGRGRAGRSYPVLPVDGRRVSSTDRRSEAPEMALQRRGHNPPLLLSRRALSSRRMPVQGWPGARHRLGHDLTGLAFNGVPAGLAAFHRLALFAWQEQSQRFAGKTRVPPTRTSSSLHQECSPKWHSGRTRSAGVVGIVHLRLVGDQEHHHRDEREGPEHSQICECSGCCPDYMPIQEAIPPRASGVRRDACTRPRIVSRAPGW